MSAKEQLEDIRDLGSELAALEASFSGDRSTMQLLAESVIMQSKRWQQTLSRIRAREEALLTISMIEDNDERAILLMRYVLGKDWAEITDSTGYSETSVFRLHQNALKTFERTAKSWE